MYQEFLTRLMKTQNSNKFSLSLTFLDIKHKSHRIMKLHRVRACGSCKGPERSFKPIALFCVLSNYLLTELPQALHEYIQRWKLLDGASQWLLHHFVFKLHGKFLYVVYSLREALIVICLSEMTLRNN